MGVPWNECFLVENPSKKMDELGVPMGTGNLQMDD